MKPLSEFCTSRGSSLKALVAKYGPLVTNLESLDDRVKGFRFRERHADWKGSLDVDQLREVLKHNLIGYDDVGGLQRFLDDIVYIDFEAELQKSKVRQDDLVRIVKYAQYTIEYLLFTQQYLVESLDKLAVNFEGSLRKISQQESSSKFTASNSSSVNIAPIHCPYCPKSFLSDSYLQNHMLRRHTTTSGVGEESRSSTPKSLKSPDRAHEPSSPSWKEEINDLKAIMLKKFEACQEAQQENANKLKMKADSIKVPSQLSNMSNADQERQMAEIRQQHAQIEQKHREMMDEFRQTVAEEKVTYERVNAKIEAQYKNLKEELGELKACMEQGIDSNRSKNVENGVQNIDNQKQLQKLEKRIGEMCRIDFKQMNDKIDRKVDGVAQALEDTKKTLNRIEEKKMKDLAELKQSRSKESKNLVANQDKNFDYILRRIEEEFQHKERIQSEKISETDRRLDQIENTMDRKLENINSKQQLEMETTKKIDLSINEQHFILEDIRKTIHSQTNTIKKQASLISEVKKNCENHQHRKYQGGKNTDTGTSMSESKRPKSRHQRTQYDLSDLDKNAHSDSNADDDDTTIHQELNSTLQSTEDAKNDPACILRTTLNRIRKDIAQRSALSETELNYVIERKLLALGVDPLASGISDAEFHRAYRQLHSARRLNESPWQDQFSKCARKVDRLAVKLIEKFCKREEGDLEDEETYVKLIMDEQNKENIKRDIRESFGGVPSGENLRSSSPKPKLIPNITKETVEMDFLPDEAPKAKPEKVVTFSSETPITISDAKRQSEDSDSQESPSSFDYSS